MKKLLGLMLFGAVAASTVSGCYVSDRPAVYGPARVWVAPHYAWNGYARVWVPGHWRRA
jgi:hypothetical protein